MNKSIFLMLIFFMMSTTIGCMPKSLKPDAQNITILYDQHNKNLKSCTFMGKISDKDVHGKKLHFTCYMGLRKKFRKG